MFVTRDGAESETVHCGPQYVLFSGILVFVCTENVCFWIYYSVRVFQTFPHPNYMFKYTIAIVIIIIKTYYKLALNYYLSCLLIGVAGLGLGRLLKGTYYATRCECDSPSAM